jgi:hypothetical protein
MPTESPGLPYALQNCEVQGVFSVYFHAGKQHYKPSFCELYQIFSSSNNETKHIIFVLSFFIDNFSQNAL